jgi:hypothetical protein
MLQTRLFRALLLVLLYSLSGNASSAIDTPGNRTITIYRPTAYMKSYPPCAAYNTPANAIDGISSTSAWAQRSAGGFGSQSCETWFGFPAGAGVTPKVLKITSKVFNNTTIPTSAVVWYSLNSGANWTFVYITQGSRAQTTDSILLPDGQNITQVQVQAKIEQPEDDDYGKWLRQDIYDIWIEEGNP